MMLRRPLEKFVDPLPMIETMRPQKKTDKVTYYEMRMVEVLQHLHRDLPPTPVWGFEGRVPGPTIDVGKDERVGVKWMNHLPDRHLLPVDQSIHEVAQHPEVRTVTHLHGGATPWESDGYPEAWFTSGYTQTGPFFKRKIYQYPNHQRATTLWYHDHAMGITRLNNYAGLAGMYIIRDEHEKSLNLPEGDYEIPLIVQDRSFHEDGSLYYPRQPDSPSEDLPDPSIQPFFCGDTILVNGKVWPYLRVEPRKYRFRLLNASNTRDYEFSLDSGQVFYQIGTDGGLLPRPVEMEKITLFPAERADVIIDFSEFQGEDVVMKNGAGCGGDVDPATDGNIMKLKVGYDLAQRDDSDIPDVLSKVPYPAKTNVQKKRNLLLVGSEDVYDRPLLLLNNEKWDDPITETPRLGNTEMWTFINTTDFPHPMHVHLVEFQILARRPFDLDQLNKTGKLRFTGPTEAPAKNERGLKDTVVVPSGYAVRIIAKFAPYAGYYVWHCHILEHEDYDMMRPFKVWT